MVPDLADKTPRDREPRRRKVQASMEEYRALSRVAKRLLKERQGFLMHHANLFRVLTVPVAAFAFLMAAFVTEYWPFRMGTVQIPVTGIILVTTGLALIIGVVWYLWESPPVAVAVPVAPPAPAAAVPGAAPPPPVAVAAPVAPPASAGIPAPPVAGAPPPAPAPPAPPPVVVAPKPTYCWHYLLIAGVTVLVTSRVVDEYLLRRSLSTALTITEQMTEPVSDLSISKQGGHRLLAEIVRGQKHLVLEVHVDVPNKGDAERLRRELANVAASFILVEPK